MSINSFPTLSQIRARLDRARQMKFTTGLNAFAGHFDTDVERDLYQLAGRCWNALQAALADLELYVGKEPTIAEEQEYAAGELVRLQEVEDRLRRLRLELIGGTYPDPISRAALVHQLTVILGDAPAEGEAPNA